MNLNNNKKFQNFIYLLTTLNQTCEIKSCVGACRTRFETRPINDMHLTNCIVRIERVDYFKIKCNSHKNENYLPVLKICFQLNISRRRKKKI